MKYIELSHKISSKTPVYPHDSPLLLFQEKFLEKDKFVGYRLETGLHVGTHIDCPSHLTDSKIRISDYSLEKFIGKGVLFDVRGKQKITVKDFDHKNIPEGSIVLLLTGYDSFFFNENYFSFYPEIDESVADFLALKKVKMLGMDASSPDQYPFPIHHKLFHNNILIIENLTNLSSLLSVEDFIVYAIPLNIAAEASLARVFAQY